MDSDSKTSELPDLFASLEAPDDSASSGHYAAVPIPGLECHRLGKDAYGDPSILLAATGSQREYRAPIALEHLLIQHGVECRIVEPSGKQGEGTFTIVSCVNSDSLLRGYFLRFAAPILRILGSSPAPLAVDHALENLVELFRSLSRPSKKTIQGLWAELFVINSSNEPPVLVRSWHARPTDLYDFSSGSQRIEVKSASGQLRKHYFSLDQLAPLPGVQVLVVSVLVESAQDGLCLIDLLDQVRQKLAATPDLVMHIDQIVSTTLGTNWEAAFRESFDQRIAINSLSFFAANVIPSVNPKLPDGVSNVRFQVDLTSVPSLMPSQYHASDGIFRALARE